MIVFVGTSHAAQHLKAAAIKRGCNVLQGEPYAPYGADLIFISEDTPTNDKGERDLEPIRALIEPWRDRGIPIVLTSQVPPGFTRSLGIKHIYQQAETLRMKDAEARAFDPDYIIVGCAEHDERVFKTMPDAYFDYLNAFPCQKLFVSYEEAEMSKIAVNMMLAAQVDATNTLAKASAIVGANWERVAWALKLDKRIGPHAYLSPGRWQDSKHLLRDHVTLEEISTR